MMLDASPWVTMGKHTTSTNDCGRVVGTGARAPGTGDRTSPVMRRRRCAAGMEIAGSAPRAARAEASPAGAPPGAGTMKSMIRKAMKIGVESDKAIEKESPLSHTNTLARTHDARAHPGPPSLVAAHGSTPSLPGAHARPEGHALTLAALARRSTRRHPFRYPSIPGMSRGPRSADIQASHADLRSSSR